jgi:hypothetical protein
VVRSRPRPFTSHNLVLFSEVLVGYVDELSFRLEGALGELRVRRAERTAGERIFERGVYLAGIALDFGTMQRP